MRSNSTHQKNRSGLSRQQKGGQTAILKFHPLPDYTCPRGRERRHYARFSSQHHGLIVFPDRRLERLIKSKGLVGKSMEVHLHCLDNKCNQGKRFEASVPPSGRIEMIRTGRPLQRCQAPLFIIDARNFFLSMRTARNSFGDLTSLDILQGIMRLFDDPPCAIRLYLCDRDVREFRQDLEQIEKFFDQLNGERGNNKYAVMDIRKPKTIYVQHQMKRQKRDMDSIILPSIGFLASEHPETQALALFTGDGDFEEVSRIWLGLNGHDYPDSPLGRQLLIVSSQLREQNGTGALSRELRELANKPCVSLALIEHLL